MGDTEKTKGISSENIASSENMPIPQLNYTYLAKKYYDVWLDVPTEGKVDGDSMSLTNAQSSFKNVSSSLGAYQIGAGTKPGEYKIAVADNSKMSNFANIRKTGGSLLAVNETTKAEASLKIIGLDPEPKQDDPTVVYDAFTNPGGNMVAQKLATQDQSGVVAKVVRDNGNGTSFHVVLKIDGTAGGGLIDVDLTEDKIEIFKNRIREEQAICWFVGHAPCASCTYHPKATADEKLFDYQKEGYSGYQGKETTSSAKISDISDSEWKKPGYEIPEINTGAPGRYSGNTKPNCIGNGRDAVYAYIEGNNCSGKGDDCSCTTEWCKNSK
ncbi:MAG: hypothetical protein V1753_02035 [Pseudomonadota bacterium]